MFEDGTGKLLSYQCQRNRSSRWEDYWDKVWVPAIHPFFISHLLFLKINVFNDIGFGCFGLALKAVGDNYDKKVFLWSMTEDRRLVEEEGS